MRIRLLTPEAINELEIALGVRFPQEYADFLLQFNGGTFYRSVGFELPHPIPPFLTGALVRSFFGEPRDGIEHNGLLYIVGVLRDRISEDYLPIADCNFDDLVLLKVVGPQFEFQGVWFWDSTADVDEPSVHWLADSFIGFLSMLEQDVCEEDEEVESLPLFLAIERGNLTGLERYLGSADDLEARNQRGHTLLAAAAIHQRPKIVRLLLEHGADPNVRDHQGRTPLHHAASHSIDSVKLLLAAGADVKARDNQGKSVLGSGWSYRADQILRRHGAERVGPTSMAEKSAPCWT